MVRIPLIITKNACYDIAERTKHKRRGARKCLKK